MMDRVGGFCHCAVDLVGGGPLGHGVLGSIGSGVVRCDRRSVWTAVVLSWGAE